MTTIINFNVLAEPGELGSQLPSALGRKLYSFFTHGSSFPSAIILYQGPHSTLLEQWMIRAGYPTTALRCMASDVATAVDMIANSEGLDFYIDNDAWNTTCVVDRGHTCLLVRDGVILHSGMITVERQSWADIEARVVAEKLQKVA